MTLLRNLLFAAAFAGGLTGAPALADHPRGWRPPQQFSAPPREQERAWEATRDGRSMPLPMLERRVVPMMGGEYLGPEMNGDTYRFKFMQNGRLIWVDVDGQGRIIRRSRDR